MKPRLLVYAGLVAAGVLLAAGLVMPASAVAPLDELGTHAWTLAVVVAAALLGGHFAVRLGQAAVLGELVVGMVLGNLPGSPLHGLGTDPYLDVLARVGMLLLLFEVGLDLSVRDLIAVGSSSLLAASLGTAASLLLGAGVASMVLPDAAPTTRWFLGAAITATSVGITARVLKDLGASRSRESQIVLGAAVIDDVMALIVLGVVAASLGAGTSGSAAVSIAALVMKTIGFLGLALVLGTRLTPGWFRRAAAIRRPGALLALGLMFCFGLSWAAAAVGLSSIVGAFAAGLVLEDVHSKAFVERGEPSLNELLQPMTSFLVPLFFLLVGFRTNLSALAHPSAALLSAGLVLAAILGKLACAGGVLHRGARRLAVAAGMIPRGEVALVFAALGGSMLVGGTPLLDERGYSAIVAVVVLTTLITPPALKWAMRGARLTTVNTPAA